MRKRPANHRMNRRRRITRDVAKTSAASDHQEMVDLPNGQREFKSRRCLQGCCASNMFSKRR
jgi:hypothetical protein